MLSKQTFYILLLLFSLMRGGLFAQQPFMKHISDENGLPSNGIYQIVQDRKGYIWIGTEYDVIKYNGIEFQKISSIDPETRSLNNFVEDSKGVMWVRNFEGKIYSIVNQDLFRLRSWDSLNKEGYPALEVDNQNNLWITSSSNPVYQYNPMLKKYIAYNSKDICNIPNLYINPTIAIQNGEKVFVSVSNAGIFEKTNQNQWKRVPIEYNFKGQTQLYNEFNLVNSSNNIFAINRGNGLILKYDQNKFRPLRINTYTHHKIPFINSFATSGNGEYFISTYDGVYYFENEDAKPVKILSGEQISCVVVDREENILISSLKNGLYIIPNMANKVIQNSINIEKYSTVSRIVNYKNQFVYLAKNNGKIDQYDNQSLKYINSIDLKVIKDCESFCLNPYNDKLYTFSLNLHEINLQTNKQIKYQNLIGSLKDMMFAKGNVMFASTNNSAGFYLYAKDTLVNELFLIYKKNGYQIQYFKDDQNKINTVGVILYKGRSKAIYFDESTNIIWAATFDGVLYFKDGKSNKLLNAKNEKIIGNQIIKDFNGNIWIASSNEGLIGVDKKINCIYINKTNFLKNNLIKRICVDSHSIWGATATRILNYNFKTKKLTFIGRSDGLLSSDIYDIAICKQNLWVACNKGVQVFPVDYHFQNKFKPTIEITDVSVFDKSITCSDSCVLPYDKNYINITFKGVSISSLGKFFYKYRMLGLDTNWYLVTNDNNSIRFPSLAPGEYIFEVKTIDDTNLESEIPAHIKIIILKPFWQNYWFYFILTILIIILIIFIYRIRMRNSQRSLSLKLYNSELELQKSKTEQDLRISELNTLKAQLNPHFIFNALNSIQEFILNSDKLSAQIYLGKFSSLMRAYLDMSQMSSVSINEEISTLKLYLELEALRFDGSLEYYINCQDDLLDIEIPPMLIQPFVENSIKHGLMHLKNKRLLKVTITKKEDEPGVLECIIYDNGIGREASKLLNISSHKSFGSSANIRRLELLNISRNKLIGLTYIDLKEADQATGTQVVLTIPFKE